MEMNVIVTAKTNTKDIPTGTIGAIIDFYSGGEILEVEFVKSDGSKVLKTVLLSEIDMHADNICENIRYGEKKKCEDLYDCCDCGGNECDCPYCFSCNSCIVCLITKNQ